MAATRDERDRILQLVEAGQITALQAAELLDALELDDEPQEGPVRNRTVRIRVTNTNSKPYQVQTIAVIPVNLLRTALRLGAQLLPQLGHSAVEDLLRTINRGSSGRLLDVQNLEQGERMEIFVE